MMDTFPLTVWEAAKELGVGVRRVQQLCREGILPCRYIDNRRTIVIERADLDLARRRNKVGRPRKEQP